MIILTDEQWKQYMMDGQRFIIEAGKYPINGEKLKATAINTQHHFFLSKVIKADLYVITNEPETEASQSTTNKPEGE